jgi:hypothetical protein
MTKGQAPLIFYVAKKWQLKDRRRFPIANKEKTIKNLI